MRRAKPRESVGTAATARPSRCSTSQALSRSRCQQGRCIDLGPSRPAPPPAPRPRVGLRRVRRLRGRDAVRVVLAPPRHPVAQRPCGGRWRPPCPARPGDGARPPSTSSNGLRSSGLLNPHPNGPPHRRRGAGLRDRSTLTWSTSSTCPLCPASRTSNLPICRRCRRASPQR